MRAFVVVTIVAALVGISPAASSADGGAYISLDETYYVVGDTAVATAYVAIPNSRVSVLDRGPFYAYILDDGSSLRAGSPIPSNAIRVGAFSVTREDGAYEFEARFTMPALAHGWHSLRSCNEPCTITGFREPLEGSFYVVETEREAALLIENGRLQGQLAGARRDTAKAERALESMRNNLADADQRVATSVDEILQLRSQLATASADAASAQSRSDTERRAALVVASELALGCVALMLLARRRRMRRSAIRKDVAVT
jgi:hypothetical protein